MIAWSATGWPSIRLLSGLLLLSALPQPVVLAAEQATDGAERSDLEIAVDRYLEPLVELNDFAGVVLISRGAEVLASRTYGYADLEKKRRHHPEQRFQIASISKQFTAAAVLTLEEAGALSIDDPLARYLPEFPGGQEITILSLLTHTSGLGDLTAAPSFAELAQKGATLSRLAEVIASEVTRHGVGTYRYSNAGFVLLAHLLEQTSGRPCASFIGYSQVAGTDAPGNDPGPKTGSRHAGVVKVDELLWLGTGEPASPPLSTKPAFAG